MKTPDSDDARPERRGPGDRPITGQPRDRILAAVARVLAERGYAGLTVERITEISGLSRGGFHDHFHSKEAAVEAAMDGTVDRFLDVVLQACGAQEQWPLKVKVAIGAALDYAAAAPAQAAMLDPQGAIAGRRVSRRATDARDRLASLLSAGRRYMESGADLPMLTEQAIVTGLIGLASTLLSHGEGDRLPDLAPQFVELALLPYLGQARAAQIANRPAPRSGEGRT